jgi:hypothetical protein
MYSLDDNYESECTNQPAEEQVFASYFLFDDITNIFGEPRYDEYNDDYEVSFLEQQVACSLSENDPMDLYMDNLISSYLQPIVCLL